MHMRKHLPFHPLSSNNVAGLLQAGSMAVCTTCEFGCILGVAVRTGPVLRPSHSSWSHSLVSDPALHRKV